MVQFDEHHWALILGGSSGFGLASAAKLGAEGLNVCVVHRDRRGAMDRITREFDAIRAHGRGFLSLNLDALSAEGMSTVIAALHDQMGPEGRVRLLLHSIAFGNLRPVVAPPARADAKDATAGLDRLAQALGVPRAEVDRAVRQLADEGETVFQALDPVDYGAAVLEDEDMARTIYSMGTSLLTWVQRVHAAGLFASDARVIGLTSEGNEVAWRGYAAVAAAKSALESVSRAVAVEFGPYGIRSNIVQPGVTDTPALRLIPGASRMKAGALRRNPLGRLTTPEDVAGLICLLCTDEARWVNGSIIRVDGGEHVA
ncbi:MAG: SDR family oxidoreductase [Acidobacteria bacterium]|nr:MAG: SDR family oxidoreductase [Acidobacteriota bacterium]RPJ76348.1 MAG: SDR family oxidoreductase [Acidobacteriota bacterium]